MMARFVATAMPLSAPSVVPLAIMRLSLRTSSIGSFAKSCFVPAFFSQTMSRWPCRQSPGTPSRPREAGFRTSTFPALSCFASSLSFFAKSITNFAAASSCFEQRGTREKAAKCFHTSAGSRPSIGVGMKAPLGPAAAGSATCYHWRLTVHGRPHWFIMGAP